MMEREKDRVRISHSIQASRSVNMARTLLIAIFGVLAFGGLFVDGSTNPGVIARTSQKFLNLSADFLIEMLRRIASEGISIPDQSDSASTYVSSLECKKYEINIWKMENGKLEAKIKKGVGVSVVLKDVRLFVRGKFSCNYKLFGISTNIGGTFDMIVNDVATTFLMTTNTKKNGSISMDIQNCTSYVGKIDLDVHTSKAWLVQSSVESSKANAKRFIKNQVCKFVTKGRDMAGASINNGQYCIDKTCSMSMNMSLVRPPVFDPRYIEAPCSGIITFQDDKQPMPFEPQPFECPVRDRMITMCLDKSVVDSMMESLYRHNMLNYRFTKRDLAWKNKSLLETSCRKESTGCCVAEIVPKIAKTYPKSTVEFYIKAKNTPNWSANGNITTATADGRVSVDVRKSDGSVVTVAKIDLSVYVEGPVYFKNNRKCFYITNYRLMNITIKSSENHEGNALLGNDEVEAVLRKFIKCYILPRVNGFGKEGYPIPTFFGTKWENPTLEAFNSEVYVFTTDVQFPQVKPPQ